MEIFGGVIAGLLFGILAEGLIKPVQIHLFKMGWRLIDKQTDRLEAEAEKTISELDDFFLAYLRENYDKLTAIVDRPELSDEDKNFVAELAANSYRLDILFEKIRDV